MKKVSFPVSDVTTFHVRIRSLENLATCPMIDMINSGNSSKDDEKSKLYASISSALSFIALTSFGEQRGPQRGSKNCVC